MITIPVEISERDAKSERCADIENHAPLEHIDNWSSRHSETNSEALVRIVGVGGRIGADWSWNCLSTAEVQKSLLRYAEADRVKDVDMDQ